MKKRYPFWTQTLYRIEDVWYVFVMELRRIFRDGGVMLIFFGAGVFYPLLYPMIYLHEAIVDMPIAVVDECDSQHSREYIRKLDACRDVRVVYKCMNLSEARQLYEQRKIHGVVMIDKDFERAISTVGEQAMVSVYCDMSSFLYYKNLLQASNFVMLDEHVGIQTHRYQLLGNDRAMAELLSQPMRYESQMLYNPGTAYPSFLLPAVLMLIVYQTLFFGICMLAGIAREENGELYFIEGRQYDRSTFRLVLGRGMAYLTLYMAIGSYVLLVVPRIFGLPHIGMSIDILKLLVPFLLATIFFAMTLSVFIRERETGMVMFLFTSIPLLFLTGCSWPTASMPQFWKIFAMLFPSTWGVNGFLHINSCGATLWETRREYYILWAQAGIYFFTACASYMIFGWYYAKTNRQYLLRMLRLRRRQMQAGKWRLRPAASA